MVKRVQLDLNTDCIERFDDNKFLVGSYQLDKEKKNTRHGKLYSFDSNDETLSSTLQVSSGILDLRVHDDNIIMALADGKLFYQNNYFMINPNVVNLSLGLNSKDSIAVGHDNGNVSIVSTSSSSSIPSSSSSSPIQLVTWQVSSLEVWTLAYMGSDNVTLVTGSDDCKIRIWDVPSQKCKRSLSHHNAGVCHLLSLDENTFISSGYDKRICFWDIRVACGSSDSSNNNNRNESRNDGCIREYSRGGGIWKMKRNPWNDKYMVLACMYDGFWIFDMVKGEFINHLDSKDNIAYGCDWIKSDMIASCTFYNNQVQIWNAFSKEKGNEQMNE